MKQVIVLFILSLTVIANISCGGSVAPVNSSTPGTPSAGNSQFSCTIDGQAVSGGPIDALQEFNTAFIEDVDQGKELLFYLTDAKSTDPGSQPPHRLRFAVPDKTGESSFGHEENGWGILAEIAVNKAHTARYDSDSWNINITSLSATRVSGTFSGKFTLMQVGDNQDKRVIEITNGKFDIPFSTGNMRPT
jgi:hypothetical protein